MAPMVNQIKSNTGCLPEELSADAGYLSEENLTLLEKNKIKGYVALGNNPSESERVLTPGTLVYKMRQRFRKAGRRTRYRFRKTLVEPVFGTIKAARGVSQFLLRGCRAVKAEWAMICIAHNLLKLANLRT
jgi:hypothetical protein